MKDKNWMEMVKKQGQLRHFGSMAIKKAKKNKHTSAQEIDLLFRVAIATKPVTPSKLTASMGISKTIVSRLIEQLLTKKFIEKEVDALDKRSYVVTITALGKEEIDKMYNYYLQPLYLLKEKMGKDKFEEFFQLMEEANEILRQGEES